MTIAPPRPPDERDGVGDRREREIDPPAPVRVSRRRRRAEARSRVRTSRVVLRRIDSWSVLKVSLLFYLSACIVLLTAGILLWVAADRVGVVDNVESFISDAGFPDFRFLPGQILRGCVLGGAVLVVAGTFANVLLSVLFNLISDVVGGLRLVLAEDDGPRRPL